MDGQAVFFVLLGVPVVGGIIFGIFGIIRWVRKRRRERREAFARLAAELGFSFRPDRDRRIADRYAFLDSLDQGSNRYAYNILSGEIDGESIEVFDYHYETHYTDDKGRHHTNHHHFSFFVLLLSRTFPELRITKEGFFSKIAQAIGFDDIDFESHEFSRRFCVKSRDKKFAYDICNAQMIDYLLANTDLAIEIESNAMAIGFDSRLSADGVRRNLERLCEVRRRIPEYLFS